MKPYGHRVCLDGGVFAEATLRLVRGAFEPFEWTYPSYRRPEVREFLARARRLARERLG